MKCRLCGYKFDEKELLCHSQCPMAESCAIICCPNCGYQAVDESKSSAAGWARKLLGSGWWRRARSREQRAIALHPPPSTLHDLAPGQSAEVIEITSADPARLLKLSALGIAPGSLVTLLQRTPACIVRVDETFVSLEGEVVGEVMVKKVDSSLP